MLLLIVKKKTSKKRILLRMKTITSVSDCNLPSNKSQTPTTCSKASINGYGYNQKEACNLPSKKLQSPTRDSKGLNQWIWLQQKRMSFNI